MANGSIINKQPLAISPFYILFISNLTFPFTVPPCELTENGGCLHICKNNGEEAVCSCVAGYKLAADGKGCDEGMDYSSIFYTLLTF